MVDAPYIGLIGVYAKIRKACDAAGGQSAWARQIGVTPSTVSDTLNTRCEPGQRVLDALGLTRAVVFFPRKEKS